MQVMCFDIMMMNVVIKVIESYKNICTIITDTLYINVGAIFYIVLEYLIFVLNKRTIYIPFVVIMCICAFYGLHLDIYMNIIIACYGDFYNSTLLLLRKRVSE